MDVQIAFNGTFFDLALTGGDLAGDEGLRTAVAMSLFSDRRAGAGDEIPDGGGPRGWWGDTYPDRSGDRIGSRLWLLARAKQTSATARRAEHYAREALQWLVEDGLARRVGVTAEWIDMGVLALAVKIERPDGASIDFKFYDLWEGTYAV